MHLLRRLAGAGEAQRSDGVAAKRVWSATIRGDPAHHIEFSADGASVYVSDGWGVTYSGLRFTRFDAVDGQEQAHIRTGTAIRCFADVGGGDLLAATDSKLFRLDARTLAERSRWDRRVPSMADSIAVSGDQVALANWHRAGVSIFDLSTGRLRRKPTGDTVSLIDLGGAVYVVSGSSGGIDRIDLTTGAMSHAYDTPAIITAAVVDHGSTVLGVLGKRAIVTSTSMGPAPASDEVILLAPGRQERRVRLPASVREVVAGRTRIGFFPGPVSRTEQFLLITDDIAAAQPRFARWNPPKGEDVVAFHPDAGLVLTVGKRVVVKSAELNCYRLEP